MNSISKKNFLDIISKCISEEQKFNGKPIMAHFHSNIDINSVRDILKKSSAVVSVSPLDCNPHSKGPALLEGKLIHMEEYPELSQHFFPPFEYKEKETTARCFLFFFYGVAQLQPDYINYCKLLFKEIQLPVIYLVNDYSEDPLNAMQDDFFEHIDILSEN